MNGEIKASDVVVEVFYRARCTRPDCGGYEFGEFPDYAGAKADKLAHLRWHRNQRLQQLHERARQRVGRLTLPGLLRERRAPR